MAPKHLHPGVLLIVSINPAYFEADKDLVYYLHVTRWLLKPAFLFLVARFWLLVQV